MVSPLARLWTDTCDVTVRREALDPETGRTVFTEEQILSGVPCRISFRLSFETVSTVREQGMAAALSQSAKLFIGPEAALPPGSRITVRRGGRVFEFARSSAPAQFGGHQEIRMERWKGWA